MKVLVTGGTGFIGTNVVKRLASGGHDLRCLVRKTSNVGTLKEIGATLFTGDVTDKGSIINAMEGCDWVINLANVFSFWEPDRQTYYDVNVQGTKNVMECILETGVSKVVHISTGAVYGKPADCPFNEDSPVGPVRFSAYSQSKYEGELAAWELYKKKGLPLVVIYPGGVLGPEDTKLTGDWMKNLINRKAPVMAYNDTVFTFVHVKDVAEAIVRAAEKQDNIGQKYLVGKYQQSTEEMTKLICELSGAPFPKMSLPNTITKFSAFIQTTIADLTKKPPMQGVSSDYTRMMDHGLLFDGSKAEKELGITYTPLRETWQEAIRFFQNRV
ncbi:MAG: NAD-dependent epimerase/dehydratase family protein [Eubacteriales bacterium]